MLGTQYLPVSAFVTLFPSSVDVLIDVDVVVVGVVVVIFAVRAVTVLVVFLVIVVVLRSVSRDPNHFCKHLFLDFISLIFWCIITI